MKPAYSLSVLLFIIGFGIYSHIRFSRQITHIPVYTVTISNENGISEIVVSGDSTEIYNALIKNAHWVDITRIK